MTPEQAYERFRKIVTRAARRVADESQGLEVIPLADRVQESWVRIFSRLRQIEAAKHPKVYVWKLVQNTVKDMAKKIFFRNSDGELSIRERGANDYNFGAGQDDMREGRMLDLLAEDRFKHTWLDGSDMFSVEINDEIRDEIREIDKKIERLNKALEKLSHAERRVAILSLGLDGGEPLSSKEIVSLIAQQNDGLKVSVNVVDKKRASGQKKLKKLLADLKNSIVFTYRERNSRKDKVTL